MSGNRTGFDDFDGNDGRDPALRRALDHAPDRDARPEAHTRDAILKMAHHLAAQPASTSAAGAANSASVLPWWRRLFGGGGEPRSRMPWNAAFATVLVAGFVTVLWRSEPVPEARLDGEARVGGAAAPAAEAPAAPAAAAAPDAPDAPDAPAPQAAAPAADQRAKVLRESSSAKESARAPVLPRQAAPSLAAPPPPPILAEQAEPAPAQDERREERIESERRRAPASAAPTAPTAPSAPFAPAAPAESAAPAAPVLRAAPLARQSPDAASALASRGDAQADVSGALRDASPNAFAKPIRSQATASSFSALERWTSFSVDAGTARRARIDVEGLPALLSAVAHSATAANAALDAPVEARVALYRGNARIAVLEIAGDQVRWTPQPGGTAWVGTPPAQALDALRSALAR